MKRIIMSLAIALITLGSFAQNLSTSVSTSTVHGRYEIVMSNILAKLTFKLDKYNGDVFQLVETSKGNLTFERLYVSRGSAVDTKYPDQINYQLVMSGILAKCTFLININTGETWQLVYDNKEKYNWFTLLE